MRQPDRRKIEVTASGPTNIRYELWKNGQIVGAKSTTKQFSGLTAGTYKVIATDYDCASNPAQEIEITLSTTEATQLGVSVTGTTKPNCAGTFKGSITFKATGGTGTTPKYNYVLWENGSIVNTVNNTTNTLGIVDLDAGTYKLVLTDANCAALAPAEVEVTLELADVDPLVLQKKTETKPTCGSSNGVLTFEGSGGSAAANLRYTWWKDDKILYTAGSTVTDGSLTAGKYKVVLTDAGCPSNPPKEIEVELLADVTPLTISAKITQKPTCGSPNSGIIQFTIGGGNGTNKSYSYTLLHNGTEKIAPKDVTPNPFTESNLLAGTYKIIVTDKNCTSNIKEHEVVLEVADVTPIPPIRKFSEKQPTCDNSDGSLTFGKIGTTFSGNLTYTLLQNGKQIGVQITSSNNVTFGSSTDPISPYLSAGTYKVVVTDPNCASNPAQELEVVLEVKDVMPIKVSRTGATEPVCTGVADGILEFTATGGSGYDPNTGLGGELYYELWQNGIIKKIKQDNGKFENLEAGTYKVIVYDNICKSNPSKELETVLEVDEKYFITNLQKIKETQPDCYFLADGELPNGELWFKAEGGVPKTPGDITTAGLKYTLWFNGEVLGSNNEGAFDELKGYNLGSGMYKVIVIDTICPSNPSQELNVFLAIKNIPPISSVEQISETQPEFDFDEDNYTSFDSWEKTGEYEFEASGGSGNYTYTIYRYGKSYESNTIGKFSNLKVGTYNIAVTDQLCPSNIYYGVGVGGGGYGGVYGYGPGLVLTFSNVDPIGLISQSQTKPTCNNPNSGELKFTIATGGTGFFTYDLWFNGQKIKSETNASYKDYLGGNTTIKPVSNRTAEFTDLSAGKYKVIVTDIIEPANTPAELEVELTVADATPIIVIKTGETPPTCADPESGELEFTATGGTPDPDSNDVPSFIYELWKNGVKIGTTTNGKFSSSAIPTPTPPFELSAGKYKVIVTDKICPSNKTELEVELELDDAEAIPTIEKKYEKNPTCDKPKSGQLNFGPVEVTFVGTLDYELWLDGAMLDSKSSYSNGQISFDNLETGVYKIIISDPSCKLNTRELFVNLETECPYLNLELTQPWNFTEIGSEWREFTIKVNTNLTDYSGIDFNLHVEGTINEYLADYNAFDIEFRDPGENWPESDWISAKVRSRNGYEMLRHEEGGGSLVRTWHLSKDYSNGYPWNGVPYTFGSAFGEWGDGVELRFRIRTN